MLHVGFQFSVFGLFVSLLFDYILVKENLQSALVQWFHTMVL